MSLLSQLLFDKLSEKQRPLQGVDEEFLLRRFLEPLYQDFDPALAHVLADYLYDQGLVDKAQEIRRHLSEENYQRLLVVFPGVRYQFRGGMRRMKNVPWSDRLRDVRREVRNGVLNCFPIWANTRDATNAAAINAVNNFIQSKMNEDSFYRRIMPSALLDGGPDVPADGSPVTVRDGA